jgi:hypothetical protein
VGFTVDNSSQSTHITGFWKNDTLEINSEGLREAIVSFPDIVKERIPVRINKKRVGFINALPMDAHLSYRLMLHSGFPAVTRSSCYRVQF